MHGVVLQSRVFGPARPMFHVKHLCVKRTAVPGRAPPARSRDVSRETFLRKKYLPPARHPPPRSSLRISPVLWFQRMIPKSPICHRRA